MIKGFEFEIARLKSLTDKAGKSSIFNLVFEDTHQYVMINGVKTFGNIPFYIP
jgi:hypothetical protein